MRRLTGLVYKSGEISRNPHFWILAFIILALALLYYLDFFFINLMDPRWSWYWRLVFIEFRNNVNGSLFCIPFIYAAVTFWWRGILITWLFSICLLLPRIIYYTPTVSSFVVNILFLLMPLLAVLVLALQRRWRETQKRAIEEREADRQAYIAQIFKAQEDERRRISREIHDDTTQRLWIAANRVGSLADERLREIAPDTVSELEEIKDTVLGISEDTRRLSVALRPGILDDLGLVPAIRWLVDQFGRESSIDARLVLVDGTNRQLSHDISTHLFRIAQESINNIRRHSEATQVVVALEFKKDTIQMTIKDNGKGFRLGNINKYTKQDKLGIIGIQERVRLLDGALKINSRPGKGTTISVEFKDDMK
jgi:signal transduction histidine kinase